MFFSLRLPKKRGRRGEKSPLCSAVVHKTERGLEFSAKGRGERRKSRGQMLKSCGFFGETPLVSRKSPPLFSGMGRCEREKHSLCEKTEAVLCKNELKSL